MNVENKYISQSEKLKSQYEGLVSECEKRFKTRDANHVGLNPTKVHRVYNKQFDLLTLSEIANLLDYDVDIVFKKRC